MMECMERSYILSDVRKKPTFEDVKRVFLLRALDELKKDYKHMFGYDREPQEGEIKVLFEEKVTSGNGEVMPNTSGMLVIWRYEHEI